MPVTFGSVGDITAVCLIVKDLVDALDKSQRSAAEYQQIIRELWSLDRALLQVLDLSQKCEDCVELNALRVTVVQAVEQCRLSMSGFLEKINKYKQSLRCDGSGSFLKDSAMKLKWQVLQKGEVEKFRVEVIAQCSSINMLIATAHV